MGKVMRDSVASNSANEGHKKSARMEEKARAKKKKRKKDLEDLHRKVLKAQKSLRKQSRAPHEAWQSSFIKILNGLADKREEYDKKTKVGKRKICNRILPSPLTYVYRNAAEGKSVRRTQTELMRKKVSNARQNGQALKRMNGDAKVMAVLTKPTGNEISKDSFADSLMRNILQTTPSEDNCSPVLGKTEGRRHFVINEHQKVCASEDEENLAHASSKAKSSNLDDFRASAMSRYEELCSVTSSEGFADRDFFKDQVPDPLSEAKKHLRTVYADTFRNQYLRDMNKRGALLDDHELPYISPTNDLQRTEVTNLPSSRGVNARSASARNEKTMPNFDCKRHVCEENSSRDSTDSSLGPNAVLNHERKVANVGFRKRLLFDSPVGNAAMENAGATKDAQSRAVQKSHDVAMEGENSFQTSKCDNSSLEANYDPTSVVYFRTVNEELVNREDILSRYLRDAERARRLHEFSAPKERSCFTVPTNEELLDDCGKNKSRTMKGKDRCSRFVSFVNDKSAGNVVKVNPKASHQGKTKSAKYAPVMLRRQNDVDVCTNIKHAGLVNEVANCEKISRGVSLNLPKRDVILTKETVLAEIPESLEDAETPSLVNALFNRSEMKSMRAQLTKTCYKESRIPSPDLRSHPPQFSEDRHFESNRSPRQYKTCSILDIPDDVFISSRVDRAPRTRTEPCTCAYSKNVQANDADSFQIVKRVCPQRGNALISQKHSTSCIEHRYHCQGVPENCHGQFHCLKARALDFDDEQLKEADNRQGLLFENFFSDDVAGHSHQDVPNVSSGKSCDALPPQDVRMQRKPSMVSHSVFCREGTLKHKSNQGDEALYINANRCGRLAVLNDTKPTSKNLRLFCQEGDGILNGVQNLQIFSVDDHKVSTGLANFDDHRCSTRTAIGKDASQPIKYLAYEDGASARRIPIYVQHKDDETAPNVRVINFTATCHDAVPRKTAKNVVIVPRYQKSQVVYVKSDNGNPTNMILEECLHPRQSLCRSECHGNAKCVENPSSLCGVHGAKENLVATRHSEPAMSECHLQSGENVRSLQRGKLNWQDARPRANSEYTLVGKSCNKNQTVFYGK